ncbi:diphthine synthase [Vulcanisaeta souniana]|uniref:Diphthine synthase n=2 Tax=Vulcanisaeta souniana TaxID=164452 RepID=A0A830EHQ7_9CREN|nr:diphthine synthase [Vulcanisaeta souniana]BDR93524.1 diphthine synthase [Vulcanisaeta souniana JCM 11219]GGI77835.1 diphthine synthase [Vulcanisaeta souniana JCM 11219]
MDSQRPTLYIVGLGLGPRSITREALEVLKTVDAVFMETYTSKAPIGFMEYIRGIRNDVDFVSREELEDNNGEVLIRELNNGRNTALLVIGDPMIATTHAAIAVIARKHGFNVRVVSSVSIVCALLSQLGLSPYKLGPVVTVTYPRMGVLSMRAYEVLSDNVRRGLHTILLLDIRDNGDFMSAPDAINVLREMERVGGLGVINDELMVIYAARVGWDDQRIDVSTIGNVPSIGDTPHVLVVPGLLNPVEIDYLVNVLNANEELVHKHQLLIKRFINKSPV